MHRGIRSLDLTLNWPGSRMDLLLTSPAGRVVDAHYPGATWSTSDRPRHVHLERPMAGAWRVQVAGTNLPDGPEPYVLQVSGSSLEPPVSTLPLAGFWFLAAAICFTVALVQQTTAGRNAEPA